MFVYLSIRQRLKWSLKFYQILFTISLKKMYEACKSFRADRLSDSCTLLTAN
jgi:hypothetical protein